MTSITDIHTGELELVEGMDVVVEDELGNKHEGLITAVDGETDRLYTVVLSCRGEFDDITVPESRILCRLDGDREL